MTPSSFRSWSASFFVERTKRHVLASWASFLLATELAAKRSSAQSPASKDPLEWTGLDRRARVLATSRSCDQLNPTCSFTIK